MGRPKKQNPSGDEPVIVRRKRPPAKTPEGRENELISLAYDLVEQRMLNGTATSQETTHFLKLGSTKERLEKEILEKQKKLLDAKTDAIESGKRIEELYTNAINAMKRYNGFNRGEEEVED